MTITNISSYAIKNICVLSKINIEKNWRFQPDEAQADASITYEFDTKFLEYKPMNNNNYYGYNSQNIRLNFSNMNQDPRYGQVRSGTIIKFK